MLKENIESDLKKALKEKKEAETSTLRQLLAVILNKEKEKRYKITKTESGLTEKELVKKSQLTNEEIIEVIFSETQKRKEAILEFDKGNRQDLVEKEKKEMEILQKYLPEQLSKEELEKLAKEAVVGLRASLAPEEREKVGIKDIGKVMAELMPKVRGRVKGKKVSEVVKELLCRQRQGFFIVYIIIIFLMAIILAVILGPHLLVSIGERTGIPCSPSYFSECRNSIDCWWQAKCGAGKGFICYPQCSVEKYKVNCKNGKCIWEKKEYNPNDTN